MIRLSVEELRGLTFALRFYAAVRRACGRPVDEAAASVLAKLEFALRVEADARTVPDADVEAEAESLGLRAATRREFILRLLDHPHAFEARR